MITEEQLKNRPPFHVDELLLEAAREVAKVFKEEEERAQQFRIAQLCKDLKTNSSF